MSELIPQAAPPRRIQRFRAEIDAAVAGVLGGQDYILGEAVARFEQDFAAHEGAAHAVGVASGTDALALALRGLDIGPGDEVIAPALTFAATAQAIMQCGATPRLVDVDPVTRCLDARLVEAAITPRTAAIVPVHLFGHPADLTALMTIAERHRLAVVQDAAQAHGARLGGLGHAAAYSFYPTKNLGCVGDGGAVLTNDPALADRIRRLRNYGAIGTDRISQELGFNSRLDEIQAAILLVLLGHLDEGNAERRSIAGRYRLLLRSNQIGPPPDHPSTVYHQFAIACADRDGLREHLAQRGIGSAVHYTPGLQHHPAFAGCADGPLPVTDTLAAGLLSLPIQPEVAGPVVERIAGAVMEFLEP